MDKEARIEKEKERLFKLFDNLDVNQLQTASGLIRSAAFLAVSLEDLEQIINNNGYLDEYENGANQSGVKISAAVQAYATLNAKYQSTIQKLLKIVPPTPKEKKAAASASDPKPERDPQRAEQLRQHEEQQKKEQLFFKALSAGKIQQSDYHAFMAGKIVID